MAANISREGVVRDEKGDVYLPATQRPDGSWRKPIKVKDGYVPQEEMPVYENKGVQWMKSKPACPGLNFVETDTKCGTSQSGTEHMSKAAKKNAKRKEKKRQQKGDQEESDVAAITNVLEKAKIGYKGPRPPTQNQGQEQNDPEKKMKNLRKKLRQIEELEEKIQSGELKNPEKEQLAKISKKQQIKDEIEDLELSVE